MAASTMPFSSFMIPNRKDKLGIALVGLGYYSKDLLAPALQLTEYCELKGIVTGSPNKIPVWKSKYGLDDKNIYNYDKSLKNFKIKPNEFVNPKLDGFEKSSNARRAKF